MGAAKAAGVVKGASSENDALKKFGEDEGRFVRPVVSTGELLVDSYWEVQLMKRVGCGLE